MSSYLFALGANISFSVASLVYMTFSRQVSAYWMNAFKAFVALIASFFAVLMMGGFNDLALNSLGAFLLSGFIGLAVGDLFLLSAFVRLGVTRSLVLFGFQPVFLGFFGYLWLGQEMDASKLVAIVFLLGCLFLFSLENFKKTARWEIKGLLFALVAVLIDSAGVLLSRYGFDNAPHIGAIEGHFYRCLSAVLGFFIFSQFYPLGLFKNLYRWSKKQQSLIVVASFAGTFLALLLYLEAIKGGHLASVAAIGITGPMFAAIVECVYRKEWPSRYLLGAFTLFAAGFFILLGQS
ncbi:MAG: DMT family transporter [Pseudobdellovibrionaceae bacterium]|nr:DMT family transporter [Bdellovibrionales bacterium]USN48414.1 MAG: DMT family transporter [Pseudobdellovibrionaceae bacterium]